MFYLVTDYGFVGETTGKTQPINIFNISNAKVFLSFEDADTFAKEKGISVMRYAILQLPK